MIELSVKHIPFPFPKNVHAVTLFPFIIYEYEVRHDPAIQAHERYHWKDQMKWLVVPWFIIYVCLLPFYGGFRNHPFEKSAYELQDKINARKKN
tara:strand:+ start:539 stop:820 length:282 start_codon:yes stop_codon:yes gene_type:complete